MKKVAWRITSNRKDGDGYKEFEKNNYWCETDEASVETELPVVK